ncbi:hypothetical protein GCM10011600_11880 [Pseudolysinimonas yzui]|uniref:Uncharacterized protein n=1 Tax=Pseudolysinimonas yzui TaxID=2708254 RepID=A0A8J3GPP6_9MICO|nr:hypothetical protein GCM10011600_11880 [Pseudolysinimonas yzui]
MTSLTADVHPRAWRRLAIGLLGVAAILVCLLAMQEGTIKDASGSGSVAAATQALPSAEQVIAPAMDRSMTVPDGERCGVVCAPTHEVVAGACVLALLVAVALLATDLLVTRWRFLRQVLVSLAARAAALAPPTPPSLHLLSISRT